MFPEFAEGPSVPKASRGQPTEVDPPVTSQVSQTDSDTSNTARLRIALEENRRLELAIKTVRHSAGNQLALLSAMLARQARSSGDPALQNALTTAQLRVHAVAESLRAAGWGEAGGSVSAKSLVERVAGSLSELAASAGVTIEVDVQELALERDEAASFMLIVNELTVNSLKHGFPNDMSGTIRIRFAQDADAPDRSLALMVEDNGIGRRRDDDYPGLGTTVILAAVQSLGAKLVEERTCANGERRGLRTTILKPLSHNACQ
jgi:two-component sensor histidine kinase